MYSNWNKMGGGYNPALAGRGNEGMYPPGGGQLPGRGQPALDPYASGGGVIGSTPSAYNGMPNFSNAQPMPMPGRGNEGMGSFMPTNPQPLGGGSFTPGNPGGGYNPNLPGRGNEGRFPMGGGMGGPGSMGFPGAPGGWGQLGGGMFGGRPPGMGGGGFSQGGYGNRPGTGGPLPPYQGGGVVGMNVPQMNGMPNFNNAQPRPLPGRGNEGRFPMPRGGQFYR